MTGRPAVLECAGAPRDLGLDQGGAGGEALRAWARERGGAAAVRAGRGGRLSALAAALASVGSARWGARDAAVAAVARDLERHFPQLAERLDGLALGARVSREVLLRALRPELGDAASGAPEAALAAAVGVTGGAGALLLVATARGVFGLRRSRPENGLRSLELVTPWGVGGAAGVNEAGLAAAYVPAPARPRPWPRCAAPSALLVQECLQRFSDVPGATAWCRTRPAGGAGEIWLADAGGALATVAVGEAPEGAAAPPAARPGASPAPHGAAGRVPAAAPNALEAALAPLREPHDADRRAGALAALRVSASARGTPPALALDPAGRAVEILVEVPGSRPRLERAEV